MMWYLIGSGLWLDPRRMTRVQRGRCLDPRPRALIRHREHFPVRVLARVGWKRLGKVGVRRRPRPRRRLRSWHRQRTSWWRTCSDGSINIILMIVISLVEQSQFQQRAIQHYSNDSNTFAGAVTSRIRKMGLELNPSFVSSSFCCLPIMQHLKVSF